MTMLNADLPLYRLMYKNSNRLEKPYSEDNVSPNEQKRSYLSRHAYAASLRCWASCEASQFLSSCIYFHG